MKKIIALVLALVMCLTLFAACKKKNSDGGTEKKVLVVATSPDYPPFESLENGQVVGIEVDILKHVCDKLGMEMKIEQMDFDSVIPGVQAKKYDCGMSGITVTEDRKKNVLFSEVYFNAAQVIVVKEGSSIAGKADLAGKTVSVQTGTTAESGCQDAGINIQAFAATADAKNALIQGKVDAWVVDNLIAKEMVTAGEGLKVLDEKLTEEPFAFAFPFGSEELVGQINDVLKAMIEDGTMAQIFAKYGEAYIKP